MRTVTLAAILLAVCTFHAAAQKEFSVWHFGDRQAIRFDASGEPARIAPILGASDEFREACVSMSDTAGQLLFVCNGRFVFDRNGTRMTNGALDHVTASTSQGALAFAWPGRPGIYALFTLDQYENDLAEGLWVYEIDMARRNGLGDVTSRRRVLNGQLAEAIGVMRHANGRDLWILGHEWNNSVWWAVVVTPNGVLTPAVRSTSGPRVHDVGTLIDRGMMTTQPFGDRIALPVRTSGGVAVGTFNNTTGRVSGVTVVDMPGNPPEGWIYGTEFSPQGNALYVGTADDVVRFDATVPITQMASTATNVLTGGTSSRRWTAIRRGPNGRVYVSREGQQQLIEIRDPDGAGLSQRDVVTGTSGNHNEGLPMAPPPPLPIVADPCDPYRSLTGPKIIGIDATTIGRVVRFDVVVNTLPGTDSVRITLGFPTIAMTVPVVDSGRVDTVRVVGDTTFVDVTFVVRDTLDTVGTWESTILLGAPESFMLRAWQGAPGCVDIAGQLRPVTTDVCGGALRSVIIGPEARLSVSAVPSPDGLDLTLRTNVAGEHRLRMVNVMGAVVHEDIYVSAAMRDVPVLFHVPCAKGWYVADIEVSGFHLTVPVVVAP
jgi:hypothetical protein